MEYDFSGYATKNDLLCADGRTIRSGAFQQNDGTTVPLLWRHDDSSPTNVLGHALLEQRNDGVYAYAKFNDTPQGKNAKLLVKHKDVKSLSIRANQLVERAKNVLKGNIRELSLVIAGANPGAFIDNVVMQHGDSETILYDEAIIHADIPLDHLASVDDIIELSEDDDSLEHINNVIESMTDEQQEVFHFMIGEALKHEEKNSEDKSKDERTVKDVFDSMTEEQKNVVFFMIGEALEEAEEDDAEHSDELSVDGAITHSEDEDDAEEEIETGADNEDKVEHSESSEENKDNLQHDQEGPFMKNVFENNGGSGTKTAPYELTHDDMLAIASAAEKGGSLRAAVEEFALAHSITDIDVLFPDAKSVTTTPDFLARRTEWVDVVLRETRHVPWARIKSLVADITADEARAKGYVKGEEKLEEFFDVAKRETTPQTIYKKQTIDRDDMIDITDFDVVAWMRAEMRLMLDEEIARAILLGDGRSSGSADKIKVANVRPIVSDADLYVTTVEVEVDLDDPNFKADSIVDAVTMQRHELRGSGTPTLFTSDLWLARLLLSKDSLGRRIYGSIDELKTALRVKAIVPVEPMNTSADLIGIMVNLQDYTVGADKGGAVSMFDDFDIDFNKNKYLIETRISGALVKPKSALVINAVAPVEPTP